MFESLTQFVLGDHMAGRTFDPPRWADGPSAPPRRASQALRDERRLSVPPHLQRQAVARFFTLIGKEEMFDNDARFSTQTRARALRGGLRVRRRAHPDADERGMARSADGGRHPWMPLNSLDDLLADPHLAATGFFSTLEHPTEGVTRSMAVPTRVDGIGARRTDAGTAIGRAQRGSAAGSGLFAG